MKTIIQNIIYSLLCLSLNSQAQFTNTGNIKINPGTYISFFGDLINNGTWMDTGLVVSFSGTLAQSIGGSSVTTFNNLTIKNTHTSGVTLAQAANVKGALTLNTGLLHTSSTNIIELLNNAASSGASNTSFVSGPIRKMGNQFFIFPVGKNSSFAPIAISAPAANTDRFTAEYMQSNPNPLYPVKSRDLVLDTVSTCEYWLLDRTTGISNVNVTLSWNTWSCKVKDLLDLRVARWNGTLWKDQGNGGTTGDTIAGTVITGSVVTAFSPFTLAANSTNALAIHLIGITGQCLGKNNVLSWTTASEKNNDYFTVESSPDGMTWSTKKILAGAINSASSLHYSYTDPQLYNGINYYRLRQTDINGKYSYSPVIDIKSCNRNNAFIDAIAYPNPNHGVFQLLITGNYTPLHTIEILNLMGETIYTSRTLQSTIDLSAQVSGVYFIRINSDQKILTRKIIIAH